MRRLPGPGTARNVLAAAVACATLVTAACGTQPAGSGGAAGSGSPSGAGQPTASRCSATPATTAGRMASLSNKDNGKVLCVRQGTVVAIYLQGTAARRWSPIRADSARLQPVPNGRLMLKLGETAAFFRASHPGVATVTSSLSSCPGPVTATSGPRCKLGQVFHLTLVIS